MVETVLQVLEGRNLLNMEDLMEVMEEMVAQYC